MCLQVQLKESVPYANFRDFPCMNIVQGSLKIIFAMWTEILFSEFSY